MADSKIPQRARQKAQEYDKLYSGCSQSVLGALQEELNIGNKESFQAVCTLSGGVARQGETCGAYIGALAALGLVIGRDKMEDTPTYRAAMGNASKISTAFREELKKEFGLKKELPDTLCWHIQEAIYGRSFNLTKDADYQAFIAAGGHSDTGCPKVCGIAAQIAAEEILRIRET